MYSCGPQISHHHDQVPFIKDTSYNREQPRRDISTMTQASEILDGSSTLTPFEEGTLSLLALTKPGTIVTQDPYHPETNHTSVTIRSHAICFAIIIEAIMAVPDGITRHVPSEWARECGALYTRSGQVPVVTVRNSGTCAQTRPSRSILVFRC
ncbi:hypothetical protein AB1N83_002837 [Pleurotus pulmonarius]